MKLLSRWIAILGITSASFVGPALARQLSALALPEPQVMQILSTVPVFVLTDAKGTPLASTVPDPKDASKKVQLINFFVSPKDAQDVLNTLRTKNPTVGNTSKIMPTSLGAIAQFAKQNAGANVSTQVLPSRVQLEAAVAMLRQSGEVKEQGGQLIGKDGKPVQLSTPLFFVSNTKNEPVGIQTTVKENGKDKVVTSVPFFFSQQEAQTLLERLRKQDPSQASTTKIQVASLTSIVNFLMTSNDPAAGQLELVPANEALEFLQRQQPGGAAPPTAPARPAATPAAPARPPTAAPSISPSPAPAAK
jgi:nickel transport protein